PVARLVVVVPGGTLPARRRPAGALRWGQRRLPGPAPRLAPPPLGLRRAEAVGVEFRAEVGAEHLLRPGADEDQPLVAVVRRLVLAVLSLVTTRAVHPTGGVAHVDVEGANTAYLVRAAAGQPLEPDHRPDHRWLEGQGSFDVFRRHRADL